MNEVTIIEHLKQYYSKENTKHFELLDFVGAYGSPLLAIAYSKLFWADFIEFKGMVFFAHEFDESKRKRIQQLFEEGYTTQEIEKSFNWVQIPDGVFGRYASDTFDHEDHILASILASIWGCKLTCDYPDRAFGIEITGADDSDREIGVVFFQKSLN